MQTHTTAARPAAPCGCSKSEKTMFSNCQAGGFLVFATEVDVLAAAAGNTTATPAAKGTPGDFIEVQPFEGTVYGSRLVLLPSVVDPGGGTATPVADPYKSGLVSWAQIKISDQEKQVTFKGSFRNFEVPAYITTGGDNSCITCNLDAFNGKCLEGFTETNPMQITLVNNSGDNTGTPAVVRTGVIVEVEYEWHYKWRKANGLPHPASAYAETPNPPPR